MHETYINPLIIRRLFYTEYIKRNHRLDMKLLAAARLLQQCFASSVDSDMSEGRPSRGCRATFTKLGGSTAQRLSTRCRRSQVSSVQRRPRRTNG
jgi:hypothetical protein